MNRMQINLPGLMRERMASGRFRYRVRVEGDKTKKITLHSEPGQPEFVAHYEAARAGVSLPRASTPKQAAIPKSIAWLTYSYEEHMRHLVSEGRLNVVTEKQRAAFYKRLRATHGAKHMDMPRGAAVALRDSLSATPGAADNMIKSVRALYQWAIEQGHVRDNPTDGVKRINSSTGAIPWSVEDLRQFRECHPHGTMPHLALTLFMFTAARLGDAYKLGRSNEIRRDGMTCLDWQPEKRGSKRVVVPIMPPLARALAARNVIGPTYLLTSHGQPFASKNAFGNWFRDKVKDAGLDNRSPHGIRKAAGELLALEGATQYHIMAVHGHGQARTSEVYTSGVNRAALAREAMQMMGKIDW